MSFSLDELSKNAVRELARQVRAIGLPDVLALYRRMNTTDREVALQSDVALLPPELAAATRLLVLGQAVAPADLESWLPREVPEALIALGMAVEGEDGALALDNIRLVDHLGVQVFCEQLSAGIRLYHGDDSLALARLLLPARGRVLDVCAGVGTQGLLCAWTADQVVSIEAQPEAARLYAVNSVLNGLEAKMDLRLGDSLDPVRGERFDLVCCNPPLLPVPADLPYPFVGAGGDDGLAVTRPLLQQVASLLQPGGRCYIVGTLLGGPYGPDLEPFETLARDGGIDILLLVPYRSRLGVGDVFFDGLVQTVYGYSRMIDSPLERDEIRARFTAHFRRMGHGFLYTFYVAATHRKGERGTVRLTKHYTGRNSLWDA